MCSRGVTQAFGEGEVLWRAACGAGELKKSTTEVRKERHRTIPVARRGSQSERIASAIQPNEFQEFF
jgi:hypothetical protein